MPKRAKFADALAELQRQYCSRLPARLERIRELADAGEGADGHVLDELHRALHDLCGSGASYGFPEISTAARDAEQRVRTLLEQGASAPTATRQALAAAIAQLGQAIESAHAGLSQPVTGEDDETPPITEVALLTSSSHDASAIAGQLSAYGLNVSHFASLAAYVAANKQFDMVVSAQSLEDGQASAHFSGRPTGCPLFVYTEKRDFLTGLGAVRAGVTYLFDAPLDTGLLLDHIQSLREVGRSEPFRVLLVDDSRDMLAYHAALLSNAGIIPTQLENPLKVVDALSESRPDVLILDMYMPECSGMEVARVLRMRDEYVGLPIMFLSAEQDVGAQARALSTGGDDFFCKPVDPHAFVSAVTTRARRARAMKSQMMHDGLTGLLNHTAIELSLEQQITRARRSGEGLVVAMVDVDFFKKVNDTYGHPVGDDVLRAMSRLLRHRLRKTDEVGRYGGEEFMLVISGTGIERAFKLLDELRRDFSQIDHRGADTLFRCTFSAGIAAVQANETPAAVLQRADAALYESKHGGRNRVTVGADV